LVESLELPLVANYIQQNSAAGIPQVQITDLRSKSKIDKTDILAVN
jgi:hypothetical protein